MKNLTFKEAFDIYFHDLEVRTHFDEETIRRLFIQANLFISDVENILVRRELKKSLPSRLVLTYDDLRGDKRLNSVFLDEGKTRSEDEKGDVLVEYLSDKYGFLIEGLSWREKKSLLVEIYSIDWDVNS